MIIVNFFIFYLDRFFLKIINNVHIYVMLREIVAISLFILDPFKSAGNENKTNPIIKRCVYFENHLGFVTINSIDLLIRSTQFISITIGHARCWVEIDPRIRRNAKISSKALRGRRGEGR